MSQALENLRSVIEGRRVVTQKEHQALADDLRASMVELAGETDPETVAIRERSLKVLAEFEAIQPLPEAWIVPGPKVKP